MNDYHAFTSTTSGGDQGTGGSGCGTVLMWILIIYGALSFIAQVLS